MLSRNFYALDLNGKLDHHPDSIEDPLVKSFDLSDSEKDGTLIFCWLNLLSRERWNI